MTRPLRIAVVAPLFETIPPKKYGGTERVVSYLVEELVNLGHHVTLYAACGSETGAHLVECAHTTLRELGLINDIEQTRQYYTAQLKLAFSGMGGTHDIVHIHHAVFQYHPEIIQGFRTVPVVWTDHNSIHDADKPVIFKALGNLDVGFTALSRSHRNTCPDLNWLAIIHHGLPANLLTPLNDVPPSYLAFLGRISPEKGITAAVRIAAGAGYELKVAAKVDKADRGFYENEVKPLFESHKVDFMGEINEQEKGPFLSRAEALLFPICWKEPFGLVMIEALACGCPVIAFNQGSVPEIIENGVTGFIVDTEEEAIKAVKQVQTLDRNLIRKRFDDRFTATTMAKTYVEVFEKAITQAAAQEVDEAVEDIVQKENSNLAESVRPPTPLSPRSSHL